ncbi:hypothetical protein WDU94_007134 [Cyamophila willieti]
MAINRWVIISVTALSIFQVTSGTPYLIATDPRNNQVYIPIIRWASDMFRNYIFDYATLFPVHASSPLQNSHHLKELNLNFSDLQISPDDKIRYQKGISPKLRELHANYLESIHQGRSSGVQDSSLINANHGHEGGILLHLTNPVTPSQPQTGAKPSQTGSTPNQTSTTATTLQPASLPQQMPPMEPQNA